MHLRISQFHFSLVFLLIVVAYLLQAIQTLLFIGYLLHDILELCKLFGGLRKKLKQNLDFYFYSISAPLSFVSIVVAL